MTKASNNPHVWSPHAAKPAITKLFRALPHLGRAEFETYGGIVLGVHFDADENALIAYDASGREVWRVPDFIPDLASNGPYLPYSAR